MGGWAISTLSAAVWDKVGGKYIWMPKKLSNQYTNILRCPTNDWMNILMHSDWRKATNMNKNNIFGQFYSTILKCMLIAGYWSMNLSHWQPWPCNYISATVWLGSPAKLWIIPQWRSDYLLKLTNLFLQPFLHSIFYTLTTLFWGPLYMRPWSLQCFLLAASTLQQLTPRSGKKCRGWVGSPL